MTTLVTGANGFIGHFVAAALRDAGEEIVRGVRRPESTDDRVIDVLDRGSLEAACSGADCVVHLAAQMLGTDEERIRTATEGTDNLLAAFAAAGGRRVVLASSFSVYDLNGFDGVVTEECDLISDEAEQLDGYARAKVQQERLARRTCARLGLSLVVLRPAAVWGPGRLELPELGLRVGSAQLIFGADRPLMHTYVENCADAFAMAATHEAAEGRTYNVVDDGESVTVGRYVRARPGSRSPVRLQIPRGAGLELASAAYVLAGAVPGLRPRLPGLARPRSFAARFPTATASAARIRTELGWVPRYGFEEAMARATDREADRP